MGTKDLNCLYFEKFPNLLERYDLVKEIGKGGQATVFQCRSKWGSKKDCACKTIFKGANSVDRFERLAELRTELEIMRKLASRPGVVTLKEVIIDDGFWHLIMELCECSLYSRIEKEGRLCEREAALLIRNLARIVQDFHSLGVVHRDLKPGNVLITLGGKPYDVKVADFGLSISFSGSDVPCFTDEVGTPRYYAPEVLQGSYSKEVDIWGLGVILYEVLTGMAVFSRLNDDDIEDRLRNGEDLTVTHLDWPAVVISEEAKHLILAMMHPNPEDRISLEQILSHPWVIKHSEVVDLSKGACQNKLGSRRNACAYINKVKLRRAKGEYQDNSNLRGHGHLDDPTKQGRPKREKSNDDTEKPESTRTLNRESGRGDVVPKRIKLQMLNGTWHVVKPCALVC